MVNVTLIRPLNEGQGHSFWYQSILYTTYYALNSNFCSRMHRLATIHNVTDDDDRQTDRETQHCTIDCTNTNVGVSYRHVQFNRERDVVTKDLKVSQQCKQAYAKASRMLGVINRPIKGRDRHFTQPIQISRHSSDLIWNIVYQHGHLTV